MKYTPKTSIKDNNGIFKLSLIYNNKEDLEHLKKNEEFHSCVIEACYDSLQKLEQTSTKLDLILIPNLDMKMCIEKEHIPKLVEKIIQYFTKKEEFEKCEKLYKLINQ
jgi:hypothetical protein